MGKTDKAAELLHT